MDYLTVARRTIITSGVAFVLALQVKTYYDEKKKSEPPAQEKVVIQAPPVAQKWKLVCSTLVEDANSWSYTIETYKIDLKEGTFFLNVKKSNSGQIFSDTLNFIPVKTYR